MMRRFVAGFALALFSLPAVATVAVNVVVENIRTTNTNPQTWSHAGAGSGVDGILLICSNLQTDTDHINTVTYGGNALTRLVRNTDTAGESGSSEIWFDGTSVAQGTQTVSYGNGGTTDDIHCVSITLTGAGDLESIDTDGINDDATNPSVTLNYSGRTAMAFAALFGGGASETAFTPNGNTTSLHQEQHGGGSRYNEVLRQTTAGSSDFAIGGTAALEDVAFAAVAISEISVSAPSFTVGPTLGAMTNTTAPTTFTTDQTATGYGVACPNGQTLPTVTQILAGDCTGDINAVHAWTEATVASVSDAHTFTGLTAGTVYDLAFVANNANGSSARSTIADATTTAGSTPTFDSGPTVSSQTTSAYTITYDASASAVTIFCGAYLKGATTPTGAQIEAGTNAHGTATEATTGSSDTIVLTPSESDKFPVYAPHCVLENANGYSGISQILDEFLDEPTGRQYITKAGAPIGAEIGLLDGASPAAVDGDVMDVSERSDSFADGLAAYPIIVDPTTTFIIDTEFDTSRQVLTRRFYDVSLGAWSNASRVALYVNNLTPVYVGIDSEDGVNPYLFEKDVAVVIQLDDLWTDPEGDAISNNVTNMPAGGSENGETLTGAFTTYGYYQTVTVEATDIAGDSADEVIEIIVGLRLPDLVSP